MVFTALFRIFRWFYHVFGHFEVLVEGSRDEFLRVLTGVFKGRSIFLDVSLMVFNCF